MKPSERIKEIVSMGSQPPWEFVPIPTQINAILQYLDEQAEKKAEYVPPTRYAQRLGKR